MVRKANNDVTFQSTPPARGATIVTTSGRAALGISIHAPREGGDLSSRENSGLNRISIHAPREGGDILRLAYVEVE